MRIKIFLLAALFLLAGGAVAQSSASTVYFLVAEWPGYGYWYDSYVIPLDDPADIAHARELITTGPGVGATILSAKIARGANGINRDYRDVYDPLWSWHVSDFYGFSDVAMEVCDGWPTYVENNLDSWGDIICFWNYTVVAELGDLSVPRDLTVGSAGPGLGTVTSLPVGIDCGADCSEVYDDWTEVTLTAVPEPGSVFEGWSGGACSGTGDCTFRMASDIAVTAAFSTLPPLADFSGSPSSGSAPLIVNFTDLSSGAPSAWQWDFGDGETGAAQNPAHVYEEAGIYAVSLTAVNGAGSDTASKPDYVAAGTCGNPPVRVGNVYYSTLQAAYDDSRTSTGDAIESQAVTFFGDVDLWRDMAVTFAGGNDCDYAARAMGTKIIGSLTISNGAAVVANLLIK